MRFFVPAILGLVLAVPVAAVWTEPSVPLPGGAPSEPIRAAGDQTKSGAIEFTGGVDATGQAASSGQLRAALVGIAAYRTSSTVLPGVLASAAASTVSVSGAVQAGVYGAAGADTGNAIGVYGDAANFANAWAAYFVGGSTGFGGALAVSGSNGNVVGTSGANFTADTSPDVVRATSVTTGKAGAYGTLTVDGSPGGEGAGVLGYVETAVPNCIAQNCTGVVGADTDTFVLNPGRWGGYFVGNVRITGRLYVNSRLTAAPITFSDPATYPVPSLSNVTPGTLLGLVTQTGGVTDATGGLTSTGSRLIVTDYLGNDADIARINPATLKPDSAGDVVTTANPLQQLTYDGQNLWVRSNDALRKLNGQTFAELANWSFARDGQPLLLTNAQPNAVSPVSTVIGAWRASDNTLWQVGVVNGVAYADPMMDNGLGASPVQDTGCGPFRYSVYQRPNQNRVWAALPGACTSASTSVGYLSLNIDGTVFGANTKSFLGNLGNNGQGVGVAFDSNTGKLWVSTQANAYPSGDARNSTVKVIRTSPNAANPTAELVVSLPGTTGYSTNRVTFDGTALWVTASTFGTNGFGYDGKLFRVLVSDGSVTEIDRSGTAVGASPIQDVYFDGRNLFLYGYNAGSAPRINYYLEKRSR